MAYYIPTLCHISRNSPYAKQRVSRRVQTRTVSACLQMERWMSFGRLEAAADITELGQTEADGEAKKIGSESPKNSKYGSIGHLETKDQSASANEIKGF